jgi:hypothetical protein
VGKSDSVGEAGKKFGGWDEFAAGTAIHVREDGADGLDLIFQEEFAGFVGGGDTEHGDGLPVGGVLIVNRGKR